MWWKKKKADDRPYVSAVIPAAGSSSRMGEGCNKLLLDLDGIPLLARTLLAFESSPLVDEIVVVCREEDMLPYARLCESFGVTKARQMVRGGASRAESVWLGVQACDEKAALIAIHDGARPLLTRQTLEQIIRDAAEHGAAAPLVPMKDSVKRLEDGFIAGDVPRASIAAAQTPQIFARDSIEKALQNAMQKGLAPTDDCAAAELIGVRVFASPGDYRNIKITTPEDLLTAQAFLQEMEYESTDRARV